MVVLRSLGLVLALVALASALPVREKDDNPICKECKQMITALQGVMIKANQTYEVSLKKYLDKNLCNQLVVSPFCLDPRPLSHSADHASSSTRTSGPLDPETLNRMNSGILICCFPINPAPQIVSSSALMITSSLP